jgi:formylglycine-generating enzyme required for sulfatase activity
MRRFVLFVCSIVGATLFAVPEISDLKVTPVEPLGVAIDYTVSGARADDATRSLEVSFVANNVTNIATTLVGVTNCVNGSHRVYWNMAKDGITLGETNISVKVKYTVGIGALYCVIDLSNGSSATSYPVTYRNSPPSDGFNTTEYKTTKLVLKRVDAGKFIMGDDQTNEAHRVTLTKPFYMGLFEVTQKQWELVMGSNPTEAYGKGDAYPVHYVTYNMIRGSSEGAEWPATNSVDSTSFLGKLRDRTKLDFDLPTDAQWEYTCRAGSTTTYWYGNVDSRNENYMWYYNNSPDSSREVGTKPANGWGFYDMHGNVWEYCLDWYGDLTYGENPVGSSSGSDRVVRGGSWANSVFNCTSSYRYYIAPSGTSYFSSYIGFRLSRTIP